MIRRAWGSRGYAGRAQACSNRNEGHTFTRDVRTLAHRVRDLRNEGSHVSRAEAIHCKRKCPLCMHPPVPAVPSRAVWRPHLSSCSPDTSSTTLSFRTLAGRRRWRERGGPGYSTRSEKAPACHLQRAARQRAAHRQNEGQGGPHWQERKSGDLLIPPPK